REGFRNSKENSASRLPPSAGGASQSARLAAGDRRGIKMQELPIAGEEADANWRTTWKTMYPPNCGSVWPSLPSAWLAAALFAELRGLADRALKLSAETRIRYTS